jgi:hypothetical protein
MLSALRFDRKQMTADARRVDLHREGLFVLRMRILKGQDTEDRLLDQTDECRDHHHWLPR